MDIAKIMKFKCLELMKKIMRLKILKVDRKELHLKILRTKMPQYVLRIRIMKGMKLKIPKEYIFKKRNN